MLIDFRVENYLSFKEEIVFSMETGERLRKFKETNTFTHAHTQLLKNAIIFGANGAGKSNLFSGLSLMADMIINPTQKISDKLTYTPFGLDTDSRSKPTSFYIKLALEDDVYEYGFSYNAKEIIFEELNILFKNGNKKPYFRREKNKKDFEGSVILREALKNTRDNKLLIFEGQNINDEICTLVFRWFTDKLIFFSKTDSELFELLKQKETKNIFLEFMKLADFNFVDIEVKETIERFPERILRALEVMSDSPVSENIKSRKITEFYSVYNKYDNMGNIVGKDTISYELESSGTKKMINLALTIIASHNRNITMIIDEFDDSFHLSLSKALLKIINSESNFNQFIFSSHDLNFFDCDLRVDQIYLAEKRFDGVSDLYSLFDFKDMIGYSRNDISFFKRYLEGQFGALPDIDLDGMLNLLGVFNG